MTDGEMEKAALAAGVELVKLGKDNVHIRAAGDDLAYGLEVVTGLIKTALLPLAVVNARAQEYFASKFPRELANRMEAVPAESIISPKPSVAGPALQGLGYSHEEENLRKLYVALLATAMDGRVASQAHPAFAEIIGALSAEEAHMLKLFLKPGAVPVAELRLAGTGTNFSIVYRHLVHAQGDQGVVTDSMIPAYIDNWVRLGLVEVSYNGRLSGDGYEWVKSRPEFMRVQARYPDREVTYVAGRITPTAFGAAFAAAVGIMSTD